MAAELRTSKSTNKRLRNMADAMKRLSERSEGEMTALKRD